GVRAALRRRGRGGGGARRAARSAAYHRHGAGRALRPLRRPRSPYPHPRRRRGGGGRAVDRGGRQDGGALVPQGPALGALGGDFGLHRRRAHALAAALGVRRVGAAVDRAGLGSAMNSSPLSPLLALAGYFALLSLFAVG